MICSFLNALSKTAIILRLNTRLIINFKYQSLVSSNINRPGFFWRYYCIVNKSSSMIAGAMCDNPFVGHQDNYKGMIINSENNQCSDLDLFTSKLNKSIDKWEKDGIRAIWFNFTLEYAGWVPILADNGFTFHHAEGNKVTMIKWLPENEVCGIPCYAHTMTGAGAIVLNSHNELLVVIEKYKMRNVSHWKLPGGYIEQGETIADAAIREVFEETGVKTEFRSLVAFRHSQGAAFGCCDLYFIAELKPISEEEEIKMCSREIEACQWMKIEEYINHPQVLENNRMIAKNFLACKNAGVKIKGDKSIHQLAKRQQTLFTVDLSCKT